MSRKNIFTAAEIDEIKRLIKKKIVASKDEQKRIRDRIRDIGFYFSDYSSKKGYTVADLEELIRNGAIKITGNNYTSNVTPVISKTNVEPTLKKSKLDTTGISDTKKSFAPLIWEDSEILILGTLPGERSLVTGEYYAHIQNRFWKIIASITHAEVPDTYENKKKLLKNNKIGLWDVAHSAIRKGSLDTNIANEIPNDLDGFIKAHGKIRIIGFNGTKAVNLFSEFFDRLPQIEYYSLPSTSGANTEINFQEICNRWKKLLNSSNI